MQNISLLTGVRRNTKFVGKITELAVMTRFAEMGYSLSIPFGDDAPYDVIIETEDDRLFRVQIKTGRLRNGVVMFATVSWHGHRNAPPTRYDGRIDAFAVYCTENSELYIIDVRDSCVRGNGGMLRIAPPRNNMQRGIHWAEKYRVRKGESPMLFSTKPSESGALDGD